MGFLFEERRSDSPYIDAVTRGRTAGEGSTIRPAESRWHMVLVKHNGQARLIVTGALTTSGVVPFIEDIELLWIRFALGTFMPSLPARNLLDRETLLREATCRSFWLNGSTWQYPDFDNVETFVDRLIRDETLVCDPIVSAVVQGHIQEHHQEMASRTLRHRFLQATGLSHSHIQQIERAQQAAALLRQGVSISDAVYQAGYYDQPHLTRSLRQWVGHTPAQLIRARTSE